MKVVLFLCIFVPIIIGMIKQMLHKGFSILLAVLVLFSTVSFTVEKHFCGDTLIDVAVFSEAHKCGIEMNEAVVAEKHCCKDIVEVVVGQDQLKFSSFEDLDFKQLQFIASFVCTYSNLFENLPKQIIPHKDYSPPNLFLDIQLLNDTFLI